MTRSQVYLVLFLAFAGWTCAHPPLNGAYVVTWTGDDELDQPHNNERGLLGRNMCTRGPAYWCHNITQAAECHATKHCIKKVWENPKEKLPEDKDSVCQVCLDMVKQARDQLLSNETQDELRQVLEGSCNLIPLGIVAKECRELADDFIPELIDALTSRMDPQMVCHVSGLCNSVRIDEMLAEMKELDGPKKVKPLDRENIDTCPKCEHYLGEATDFIKRLTKEDLRTRLLEICGYLGSYSESCRMGVIHDLDEIYDYIQNNVKPREICGLIGLCQGDSLHRVQLSGGRQQAASTTNVRVWQPPEKDDDMECDFCKQLTESLREWLVANTTKDEFQKVIEGLCKQTGRYKKECLNLAEQYSEQIYDVLVNGLNPEEVCKQIGVCRNSLLGAQLSKDSSPIWTIIAIDDTKPKDDSSSEEDEDDSLVMMKLLPAERLTGDDEKNAIKSKEKCKFCEYALHYLQQYLDDAQTEAEIKEKVDNLCEKYLPKAFAEQCETFVNEYGDALVTMLANDVDPSEICPRLKLCPSEEKPKTSVGHPSVQSFLPTCEICTFTVQKLISLIGGNMTKESIDAAMESVCEHIPRRMEDNCESFMKNYGDQVAEMILVYGTSHGVCAALHLCFMAPPPPKIIIESQLPMDRYLPQTMVQDRVNQMENDKDDSRGCVLCEFVITTLDQRLQDNATEEEIKAEVEHICTYLPNTVKGKCQNFVETYGEQIIQYMSQEIDPAEICTKLGMCKPQKKINEAIRHLKMDRCELCMLVSDYFSTILEDNVAERKIDELTEKTCALVPKSYRQECKAMIEDYGPYLLNILAEETDKGKACAQIQLCPNVAGDVDDNTVEVFEY